MTARPPMRRPPVRLGALGFGARLAHRGHAHPCELTVPPATSAAVDKRHARHAAPISGLCGPRRFPTQLCRGAHVICACVAAGCRMGRMHFAQPCSVQHKHLQGDNLHACNAGWAHTCNPHMARSLSWHADLSRANDPPCSTPSPMLFDAATCRPHHHPCQFSHTSPVTKRSPI